jgi:NADH-ubiquinone oxidoreductase chain 5
MYLLVIFLSLFSSILSGLFGKAFGTIGSTKITILFITASSLLSYIIFYEIVLLNSNCSIKLFPWFDSGLLFVQWGFLFDALTSTMLCVVLTVSTLVHIYSSEYMSTDPHLPRFMSYLSLFTFFMLILVTSDNFMQLFLGWEGVGLCSYLLISFWFTRLQANKSAIKAIIMNKIGDFGIALAIFSIFATFGSVEFSVVFSITPYFTDEYFQLFGFNINKITFISLLLFLGAVGKSAQLGLHTWLPDAMEGPTPVSALIHAATMVTAGVFLLIRVSPLIEYSNFALFVITIVGALTAFFAATTGLLQNDIKKVIAFSTCSQLGYMIFSCGLSGYNISLFHLTNHAFFKALLFLSAGSVIHALNNEQDMRRMGGLIQVLPFTYTMFLIGSLALAGFPFLSGFYSKDIILELASASYRIEGSFAYWLGSISALFTAFYSTRLLYFVFFSKTNNYKIIMSQVHDAPWAMAFPLIILCFGSIFIGYILKDLMIGPGAITFSNTIFVHPIHFKLIESEYIPLFFKLLPVFCSITGIILCLFLNKFFSKFLLTLKTSTLGKSLFFLLSKKWFFDNIYNHYISQSFLAFGHKYSFRLIDRGLLELIGPFGVQNLLILISTKMRSLQTGYIYHYAFAFFLGFLIFSFSITLALSLPVKFINYFLFYIDYRILIVLTLNLFIYFLRSSNK